MATIDLKYNRIILGNGDTDGGTFENPSAGTNPVFEFVIRSPDDLSFQFNALMAVLPDVSQGPPGVVYIAPHRSPISRYNVNDIMTIDRSGLTVNIDRTTILELPSNASNNTIFKILDADNVTINGGYYRYSPTVAASNGKQFISIVSTLSTPLGSSNNFAISNATFYGGGTCTNNKNFTAIRFSAFNSPFAQGAVISGNTFLYAHPEQDMAFSPDPDPGTKGTTHPLGMVGIWTQETREAHIANNTFRTINKTVPSWAGAAIWLEDSEFSTVSNNTFYGLKCYTTGGTGIFSPGVDTSNPVVLSYKTPGTEGGHTTFTGNYAEQCGGDFLYEFRGPLYITFTGNGSGRCSGERGILGFTPTYAGSWGEAVTVVGNDIHNPNYLPGTTGFTICYATGVRGVLVDSNVFSLLGNGSGSQVDTHILKTASPCGHIQLGGNNIHVWKGY